MQFINNPDGTVTCTFDQSDYDEINQRLEQMSQPGGTLDPVRLESQLDPQELTAINEYWESLTKEQQTTWENHVNYELTDGDWCWSCSADWKQPHYEGCYTTQLNALKEFFSC